MNTRKPLPIIVLPLLLAVFTGCTSLSLKKPDVWPLNISDNKPGMPSQVVTNWTDTILYPSNEVPVRGFGGRILFYADGKKDPVKVEGSLVVYAFEEKDHNLANVKPDRKFVFTKEQLATHYSKSKLGHSYSVWLPWDNAGGDQKEISLIARFMPEKGNVVTSEQTKHLLPGKTENISGNSNAIVGTANGFIQPVNYEYSATPAGGNELGREIHGGTPRNMVTTTIAIPSSSILNTPPANAVTNGGAVYPQAMPPASFNRAMPYGQTPSMPNGPVMNNPQNAAYAPGNNPAINAGMNPMNPPVPQNSMGQPQYRSGFGQPQAQGTSVSQPNPYRASWQPSPRGPGYGPGMSPLSGTNRGYPASAEGVAPTMN
jgi:hypothetical protein